MGPGLGYHGPRNTKEEEEETMAHYVTGPAIKALRERKGLTQKQLAEQILVSDKAVSKWETGKGLPDLSLLEPLAKALGVSVAELLSGEYRTNANRAGNLLRSQWYVCPVCGNVVYALGQGSFHCCGVALPRRKRRRQSGSMPSLWSRWKMTITLPWTIPCPRDISSHSWPT